MSDLHPFGTHSCYKNVATIDLRPAPTRREARREEALVRDEEFGRLYYWSDSGELQVERTSEARPPALRAPEFVSIALTASCNLRCAHCYPTVFEEHLRTEVVLDLLEQLSAMGVFCVSLSGGEPTLHPDFSAILDRAVALGFRVLLFTNGILVNEETAENLARSGLSEVNVSIDSDYEGSHDAFRGKGGAWSRSWAAVKALAAAGLPTWVTCTMSEGTSVDGAQMAAMAIDAGAVTLRFVNVVASGEALVTGLRPRANALDIVHDALEVVAARMGHASSEAKYFDFEADRAIYRTNTPYSPYGCGAGTVRARITAKGLVLGCPFVEESVRHRSKVVTPSSIHAEDFATIWKASPYLEAFREGVEDITGKCGGCEHHKAWCAGGCRADALYAGRGVDDSDPLCRHGSERQTSSQPVMIRRRR